MRTGNQPLTAAAIGKKFEAGKCAARIPDKINDEIFVQLYYYTNYQVK
jgi:hypothetical protein